MDITELQDRILRNTHFLESRANGLSEDLIRELISASKTLFERMKNTRGNFSRNRLNFILTEISSSLNQIYSRWGSDLSQGIRDAIRSDVRSVADALEKTFGIPAAADLYDLPLERVEAIVKKPLGGKIIDDWVDKQQKDVTNHVTKTVAQVQSEIVSGVIEGAGSREVAQRLRKSFGFARNGADIIARSHMLQASNDAREALYKDNEDFIPAYRYTATLDSRTCLRCSPYDGKVSKNRENLPTLIRHARCRCVITPWDEEFVTGNEKRPFAIHEERTVQHRDGSTSTKFKIVRGGQLPAKTKYSEWFARQPESFQLRVLGSRRFQWYKEGKFTLSQFTTRQRIKSIRELEAMLDAPRRTL